AGRRPITHMRRQPVLDRYVAVHARVTNEAGRRSLVRLAFPGAIHAPDAGKKSDARCRKRRERGWPVVPPTPCCCPEFALTASSGHRPSKFAVSRRTGPEHCPFQRPVRCRWPFDHSEIDGGEAAFVRAVSKTMCRDGWEIVDTTLCQSE